MSTLHSSYFPQLTASKRRQTALNQMEQLHLKWPVPLFKGSSFTLFLLPARVFARLAPWTERNKTKTHTFRMNWVDICFSPSSAGLFFGFLQCCLKQFSMLISRHIRHRNKLLQCSLARSLLWKLGNCQHTLRDFSFKRRKKTQTENRKENKSILLSCIYESICLNIEKKMYMLTNLWQNILCKAQYLKLQYFWGFLKQEKKKKHIRRTSNRLALHQGPVRTVVSPPAAADM